MISLSGSQLQGLKAIPFGAVSVDDSQDVLLGQEHVLVAAELDVSTGVLAVEHLVADADLGGLTTAVVVALAGTHLDHFAHLGLFLGGVGRKDAAGGGLFGGVLFDDAAITETYALALHDAWPNG